MPAEIKPGVLIVEAMSAQVAKSCGKVNRLTTRGYVDTYHVQDVIHRLTAQVAVLSDYAADLTS